MVVISIQCIGIVLMIWYSYMYLVTLVSAKVGYCSRFMNSRICSVLPPNTSFVLFHHCKHKIKSNKGRRNIWLILKSHSFSSVVNILFEFGFSLSLNFYLFILNIILVIALSLTSILVFFLSWSLILCSFYQQTLDRWDTLEAEGGARKNATILASSYQTWVTKM